MKPIKNEANTSLQLFLRLKEGDLTAFNSIYRLYGRKVLRFAYSFSISREDSEEIVQDTFVKLWTNREKFDPNKSIDAYLYVITRNEVLNRIKKRATNEELIKTYFKTTSLFSPASDEILDFKEFEASIHEIINTLPAKRREIFKLNRFDGKSYREIAVQLNISQGTVEKQMAKAIHAIKGKLAPSGKATLLVFLVIKIFQ